MLHRQGKYTVGGDPVKQVKKKDGRVNVMSFAVEDPGFPRGGANPSGV